MGQRLSSWPASHRRHSGATRGTRTDAVTCASYHAVAAVISEHRTGEFTRPTRHPSRMTQ